LIVNDANGILDVAIVGGGVAGVYSGWRLMGDGKASDGGPLKITLFEGSDRIGGRLLSVTPPGMPDTRCELGGMRFMSRHVLVAWLVSLFRLRTVPMPVAEPNNIAYVRGEMLRLSDLNSPAELPYALSPFERSVVENPNTALLLSALQQIVPDCLNVSYDALLDEMKTATFDGTPLHELGFWNVMARVLTPEGYDFVRTTGGYDCLVSNWSVADAIPFILADFGAGVTYSRLPDGYVEVPRTLAAQFTARGGNVQLNMPLRSFDTATLADGTSGVALRFTDGSILYARHLVLAMPRRSIELLEPTGAVLDPGNTEVRALIESVEPIPLFKIFLAYEYPWWEAVGVSQGRTLTDQPIRQCYYWDVVQKSPTTNGNSCLLASYDDDLSVSFWAGLREVRATTRLFESRADAAPVPAGSDDWNNYKAPHAMVAEAHRQIKLIHGVSYAPEPYAAAYRDWQEDPYGGGVNFWKIHAKSWEVIPAMVNPKPGVPVYVCGEAYSREQGWVEGSLQTAEIMLQQCFHLAAPPVSGANVGPS